MALTQTRVSHLYVAIFNRASEGEGNTFWQSQGDMATVASAMLATQDARDYFGDSLNSNQAFIEHIYLNTLNKRMDDDPDGIAYWVGRLQDGDSRGEVVAELVSVIETYGPDGENYDPNDAATVAAYNQFVNRVEISDYMAEQVYEVPADYAVSTAFDKNLVVTDDDATVVSARNAVDDLARAADDDPDDDDPVTVAVEHLATYDASDDDFLFVLDFSTSNTVTKVSTINGFGTGDQLQILNPPDDTRMEIQAVSAISDDLFYLREGVTGVDSWGINMGGQTADLISDLETAEGIDAQLSVLGAEWGDWLVMT
jgi:hypothetical protein